jgi:hypothetical protein
MKTNWNQVQLENENPIDSCNSSLVQLYHVTYLNRGTIPWVNSKMLVSRPEILVHLFYDLYVVCIGIGNIFLVVWPYFCEKECLSIRIFHCLFSDVSIG